MKKRSLREHLTEFYGDKSLSSNKLTHLKSMIEEETRQVESSSNPPPWRDWLFGSGLIAAGALAAVLVMPYIFQGPVSGRKSRDNSSLLAKAVVKEIALNHNKHLDIEFRTDSFLVLREKMQKLDFTIAEPEEVSHRGYRVVGARYCSIQGHLAAQIRLTDKAGETLTLYQTPLVEIFDGLQEGEFSLSGLRVELWREKGLLMGLAHPQD